MKTVMDRHRRDLQLSLGDWAMFKLQHFHQNSLIFRIHSKMAKCYFGSFQVQSIISPVAYQLKLPLESKIHPNFHIFSPQTISWRPTYYNHISTSFKS